MSKPTVRIETTVSKRYSGSVIGFSISSQKEPGLYLLEDAYGNSFYDIELNELENLHSLLGDFIKLVRNDG